VAKLNLKRSELPAITHVDYLARIQTVHKETNPGYYALIDAFNTRTGCGVIVNTSFNVRGEPIVMTPEDSYRCFMRTEMDYLVIENFLLDKTEQPVWEKNDSWQQEFELD
jgi:carbamoyltransferase